MLAEDGFGSKRGPSPERPRYRREGNLIVLCGDRDDGDQPIVDNLTQRWEDRPRIWRFAAICVVVLWHMTASRWLGCASPQEEEAAPDGRPRLRLVANGD